MWKSQKRKRKDVFERALAEMMPAAVQVSEKWSDFAGAFVFKESVPLAEQIRMFSIPLAGFFRTAYIRTSPKPIRWSIYRLC